MIISRAPFRMSFVGGGSDLPDPITANLAVRSFPPPLTNLSMSPSTTSSTTTPCRYSRTEEVKSVEKVGHPLVREGTESLGFSGGVEITSVADIPAKGTGLGSSSDFTVGLLNALHAFRPPCVRR